MWRSIKLSLAAALLIAGLATADPRVEVRYFEGVPQVSITGSYPSSQYTIWRAPGPDGPFSSITNGSVLCLGPCYGDDYDALPGMTYWYRFDVVPDGGAPVSFGPYPVTISPTLTARVRASVYPNPSNAASQIDFFLGGSPSQPLLAAEAILHDLQGRSVRTLWRGDLPRGLTRIGWDGRDNAGRNLGPGCSFLRFSSPLGTAITRVVRIR